MGLLSTLGKQAERPVKGQTYQVGNAAEFNGAAYFGGKVEDGERLICVSAKTRAWPYPIFKRGKPVSEDAPHGTRDLISMTHRAKGSPGSYGLKAPGGPGQHGGFGG